MDQNVQPITSGNAQSDSTESRGWFIGSFLEETLGLRHSKDVEMKWGVHAAGESREEWVTGETRTAVAILISGKFELEFRDQTVTLSKPGDYVMWGVGTDHKWRAVDENTTLLTIRWPSVFS